MKPLEAHPAALLFPMMPKKELQDLARDIKEKGLIEDIGLLDGKILDGRNRLKACEMAGVEPRFTEVNLNGKSAADYVASKNLRRRQLTKSQKAAAGARLILILHKEATERMAAAGKKHGTKFKNQGSTTSCYLAPENLDVKGKSSDIAANIVQVGVTAIEEATAVMKRDPELFAQIERGEISTNTAYKKVVQRKPATSKRQSATSESESEFLTRLLNRLLDALKEAGARSPTHWNPDAVPKYALIRGLHETRHEIEARLDKVQVKQNANRGRQTPCQDKTAAKKPQGAKKDSPDDQENQFTNGTVN